MKNINNNVNEQFNIDNDEYNILLDSSDFNNFFSDLVYDIKNWYPEMKIYEIYNFICLKLEKLLKLNYIKIVKVEYLKVNETDVKPINVEDLPKDKALKLLHEPIVWDSTKNFSQESYQLSTTQLGESILDSYVSSN